MKNKCIEILNKVFPNDGNENNANLFAYANKCDYQKIIICKEEVLGFIFANIHYKSKIDKFNDYLSYNEYQVNKYLTSKSAYLNLIAVDPDYQGKGIGKELILTFIDKCKQNKKNEIYLWADLTCNYCFYKSIGFEIIELFTNPYFETYCNLKVEKNNTAIFRLKLS